MVADPQESSERRKLGEDVAHRAAQVQPKHVVSREEAEDTEKESVKKDESVSNAQVGIERINEAEKGGEKAQKSKARRQELAKAKGKFKRATKKEKRKQRKEAAIFEVQREEEAKAAADNEVKMKRLVKEAEVAKKRAIAEAEEKAVAKKTEIKKKRAEAAKNALEKQQKTQKKRRMLEKQRAINAQERAEEAAEAEAKAEAKADEADQKSKRQLKAEKIADEKERKMLRKAAKQEKAAEAARKRQAKAEKDARVNRIAAEKETARKAEMARLKAMGAAKNAELGKKQDHRAERGEKHRVDIMNHKASLLKKGQSEAEAKLRMANDRAGFAAEMMRTQEYATRLAKVNADHLAAKQEAEERHAAETKAMQEKYEARMAPKDPQEEYFKRVDRRVARYQANADHAIAHSSALVAGLAERAGAKDDYQKESVDAKAAADEQLKRVKDAKKATVAAMSDSRERNAKEEAARVEAVDKARFEREHYMKHGRFEDSVGFSFELTENGKRQAARRAEEKALAKELDEDLAAKEQEMFQFGARLARMKALAGGAEDAGEKKAEVQAAGGAEFEEMKHDAAIEAAAGASALSEEEKMEMEAEASERTAKADKKAAAALVKMRAKLKRLKKDYKPSKEDELAAKATDKKVAASSQRNREIEEQIHAEGADHETQQGDQPGPQNVDLPGEEVVEEKKTTPDAGAAEEVPPPETVSDTENQAEEADGDTAGKEADASSAHAPDGGAAALDTHGTDGVAPIHEGTSNSAPSSSISAESLGENGRIEPATLDAGEGGHATMDDRMATAFAKVDTIMDWVKHHVDETPRVGPATKALIKEQEEEAAALARNVTSRVKEEAEPVRTETFHVLFPDNTIVRCGDWTVPFKEGRRDKLVREDSDIKAGSCEAQGYLRREGTQKWTMPPQGDRTAEGEPIKPTVTLTLYGQHHWFTNKEEPETLEQALAVIRPIVPLPAP